MPIDDRPPGVPMQAMGALPTATPVSQMHPDIRQSLWGRFMSLFSPEPTVRPMDRTAALEQQLDALQYKSTHGY